MEKQITLAQIATALDAQLQGDPDTVIKGIATLQDAKAGEISFLDNPKYRKYLTDTKASAVIVSEQDAKDCPTASLIAAKPYVAYAKAAHMFTRDLQSAPGTHSSAVVADSADIDPTASIGAQCVISEGVKIGAHTVLQPGCVIGPGTVIGDHCLLWANVTVTHDNRIGNHVVLHSGVVIGSDGFGFAETKDGWHKVPQLGSVIIEDNVDIGANTTIDRGALGDTVIEQGVILDNQIQIGHNARIGSRTAIAACSGLSGSVTLGKNCKISGMVGFTGHFDVTDNVMITGATVVSKAITKPGIYSSGTAIEPHHSWRKNAVRFRQLDDMARKIQQLEQKIEELTKHD